MKRCPVCNSTFDDPYLSFCPNDGTPLLRMSPEEAHTVLMSTERATDATAAPASNLPPPPQPYGWANDNQVQWTPPPPDLLAWLDKGTTEEFAVTGDFPVDLIKIEFLTKPK